MIARTVAASLLAFLAGCTGPPTSTVTRVPVPAACLEPVPERPAMPTETLRPGVDIFVFVKTAQAEIVLREVYEDRLRTALTACRTMP